jgi:hypothetical protein
MLTGTAPEFKENFGGGGTAVFAPLSSYRLFHDIRSSNKRASMQLRKKWHDDEHRIIHRAERRF